MERPRELPGVSTPLSDSTPSGWRLTTVTGIVVGAVVVGAGVAAIAVRLHDPAANTAGRSSSVAFGSGSSRLPSWSVEAWATYADYVIVVRAVREELIHDSESPMSLRTVGLTVDRVLWTSKLAEQKMPATLELLAAGTHRSRGATVKSAVGGAPRIESGHTYVMAVSWVGAQCSEGDQPVPGHFEPLGEGAMVAYDDDVIGNGEFQGAVRDAAQAQREVASKPMEQRSFVERNIGNGADELVADVTRATAARRVHDSGGTPCPEGR